MSNVKAFQSLGLAMPDLIKLTLENQNGFLEPSAYDFFWTMLSTSKVRKNQNMISFYFIALLETLTNHLKRRKAELHDIQTIVNTLAFCAYTLDVRNRVGVRDAVLGLQRHQLQDKRFPVVDDLVKILLRKFNDDEELSIEGLLRNVCNLLTHDDIQLYENLMDMPAMDGLHPIGGESMKIYDVLKDAVLDFSDFTEMTINLKDFLSAMIRMLKSVMGTLKISETTSTIQLLSLMQTLHSFLPYCGAVDTETLQIVYASLEKFSTWPRPCSDSVYQCLTILKNEIKSRGQNLVDTFLRESRVPQLNFNTFDHVSDASSSWAQPIFYFMDSSSIKSSGLYRVVRMRTMQSWLDDEKNVNDGLARGLDPFHQLQLIYYLLKTNLEVSQEECIDLLSRLDPARLPDIFYQACVIAFEGTNIDSSSDDANHVYLESNYQQLLDIIRENTLSEITLTTATPESIVVPPSLPRVEHIALLEDLNDHQLMSSQEYELPYTTFGLLLEAIVNQHFTVADEADPAILRLVVCGSDRLLHSLVCGYLRMAVGNPEALLGREIKWYIVPIEENSLAAFIARHDAWYNRHVFAPARLDPPVVPWVQQGSPQWLLEDNSPPVGPGRFLRHVLESYAREATNQFNVKIHHIQCWETERATKRTVIPMISRIEISAYATALYQKLQTGDDRGVEEIMRDKTFKPPQLYAQYMKMTLSQTSTMVVAREDPLDKLILANIPVFNDCCFPSDPSKDGLEFYGHFVDSLRSRGTPSEHRCAISSIEITASTRGAKFHVLVDGEPYGPFWRLVYVFDKNSDEIPENPVPPSLPFQTFFPIQL